MNPDELRKFANSEWLRYDYQHKKLLAFADAWGAERESFNWHIVQDAKELASLRQRLEAAEKAKRTLRELLDDAIARIDDGDLTLLDGPGGWLARTREALAAALAAGEKCRYPDWEGGLIVGEHVWGKDGTCCVCGEEKP